MGKDWLYKSTRGGGGRKSSPSLNRTQPNISSSPGCMSAIYNIFDIQQQQFRFRHPPFLSEPTINDSQHSNFCLQGIEAPRNSLESPESSVDTNVALSSSEVDGKPTKLNIEMGRIEIESIQSRLSSESCNSSGAKTPNLIARLMGLDLMPEQYSSPRPSSSTTETSYNRSRSLPVSPRLSKASRGSTDEDYYRMSLQMDKENYNRFKFSMGSSQKVKKVSKQARQLGTDITNMKNTYKGRDSNLGVFKPKGRELKHLSSSPKVRLLDIESKLNKPVSSCSHSASIKKVRLKSEIPKIREKPGMIKQENPVKAEKIKKNAGERLKINQQEKVFVGKKKTTGLPNHVMNIKKFGPLKKNMASSSSSTTRLSQKQLSLPSKVMNSPYNSNGTQNLKPKPLIICSRLPTSSSCVMYASDEIGDGRWFTMALEAEVADIVREIECEILENLVHELAGMV